MLIASKQKPTIINTDLNIKNHSKDSFKDLLQSLNHGQSQNIDKELLKMSVEEFKDSLKKYGASALLAKINEDKIKLKIAQKKEELEQNLGINDPSKTQDEKKELAQNIENLLKEYEKELKNTLKQASILERQKRLQNQKEANALAMALTQL